MEQSATGANIQQGMAIYRRPQSTLPEFCVGGWHRTEVVSLACDAAFCLHPFAWDAPVEYLLGESTGAGWEACERVWSDGFSAMPVGVMPVTTTQEAFNEEVLGIQAAIERQALQKAVAARVVAVERPLSGTQIWQAFQAMHEAYSNAFVFLTIHPIWGCWMGATPETLLRVEGGEGSVMSLAGTLTKDQLGWTNKEALEQSVTSLFIRNVLEEAGVIGARESSVGELQMGDVKHLMSEWRFKLPFVSVLLDGENHRAGWGVVDSLLTRLHPTPAVGGYPQKAALDWLAAHEGFDRSLYTGYVGVRGIADIHVFVTLRCAQLFTNGYALYAGCGVNAGSDPAVEWGETAAKMDLLDRYLR
ncbi:MAG: hypothetical protein FJX91_01440 [Bacteroidetes bacterium]|nr:hypothetical protein [Bacteroidota bacterium]